MDGLVRCQFCRAPFPRSWLKEKGAVQEILPQQGGTAYYCSAGCRVKFHLAFLKGDHENTHQVREAHVLL